MNLKDFLANKEKPPELYWSVVIETGWVQAGIWYIGKTSAEVISVSPPTAWEVEDELTGATDAALSSAIAKLPENYDEPNKTVFGVAATWVKGGEISEEYLAKIKKICTDLSLSPVGFVVLPEAIAHLYKSEEEAPVSAIILGLGNANLEISVFKLGNLVGSTAVARSVSLTEDVTEGLTRFEGAAPLPSRFIVYDGKGGELEEAKETLMQASWDDAGKVKFLHTPKVETLASDRKVLATSLAGANELGDVKSVSVSEEESEKETAPPEEVQNVSQVDDNITPEELGFAVGSDVSAKTPVETPPPPPPPAPPHPTPPQRPIQHAALHTAPAASVGLDKKLGSLFHSFSNKYLGGPKISGGPDKSTYTTVIIAGILIVVALGLLWWFYPKADVTIYVTPKKFDQVTEVTFSSTGQSDPANGVIPAQVITSQVNGDKTKATSGSKLVGDKAKGSVQIQNGTAFPINLSAGAFLISSENLKFDIDNSASVSAALSPSSPGTANVTVTADAIGAQYNLAKDEVFKVANYPKAEVDANSVADFTGGSSRQISAVSKDDQTALESQLKDELSQNAKDDLSGKVNDSQIFVSDLAGLNISTETFDHKVGDEADSLKLTLALTATGVAADKQKLLEYARGVLKDKIPGGYVLRDSQINFKFTFDNISSGNYNYKMDISANFLPQVNTDEIKKQIAGKSLDVAKSYLGGLAGFTRAPVTLKPSLPGPLGTLPHITQNITVTVSAEQ